MLVTQQPVLRRFWYAVMPMAKLQAGPQPFTLLGENIVLWQQADGTPACVADRCCHRTAKLSRGFVENGNIVCGYHGWTYDCSGACVRIPQQPELAIPAGARVRAFHAQERFGYAWVALDDPLQPLPEPEEERLGHRRIHQFDETWNTGALRLMENSFDTAHFAFVHAGTFGQGEQKKPEHFALEETDYGFEARVVVQINNPPASHRITGTTDAVTTRSFSNQWHLPFLRKLGLVYPSGIRHTIFTCATPIDDERIRLIQWLYRNDSEEDCPAALLNDWDTRVVLEDHAILHAVNPDAPVDVARRDEQSMASDRPGMLMRKRLLALLKEHGEPEVHGWTRIHPVPENMNMLTTKQNVLRRFWYALMPMSFLDDGPQPFRLMGEDIVLWKQADGAPAAVADRCCHRTAKLSKGFVENGNIVCGYHGWTYDCTGTCVKIPQQPDLAIPAGAKVPAYRAQEKYGYVWVALEDPLRPIPHFPEDGAPGFRRIHQFYEEWQTSPLRMMENSFDNSHFSYVHKANFGILESPKPAPYTFTETDYGFEAETLVPIRNPEAGHRVTGTSEPITHRHLVNRYYLPFSRRFGCTYPASGVAHIIYNCATPIDDDRMMLVQWLYRNDSEEACSTPELIAWDAAITAEDRDILEATDADACVDTSRRAEFHMASDKPGLVIRKQLLELLRAHGEEEIHRGNVGKIIPIRKVPA